MTGSQLFDGLKWLYNSLYRPGDFGKRVIQMIERLGPQRGPFKNLGSQAAWDRRPVEARGLQVLKKMLGQGKAERIFRYSQVRSLYEHGQFWEPELTGDHWRPALAVASGSAAQGLVSIGSDTV